MEQVKTLDAFVGVFWDHRKLVLSLLTGIDFKMCLEPMKISKITEYLNIRLSNEDPRYEYLCKVNHLGETKYRKQTLGYLATNVKAENQENQSHVEQNKTKQNRKTKNGNMSFEIRYFGPCSVFQLGQIISLCFNIFISKPLTVCQE